MAVRLSAASCGLAMPKSATFTRSPASSMMLAGLMSRCTMPALWAVSRASATCAPIMAARSAGMRPSLAMTRSSPTPSMNSMARYQPTSAWLMSYIVTMLGCLIWAATRASRWKRSSISSMLAPAATSVSRRMVLIATMRPRILSLALKTVPKAPAPSFLTTW